MFLMLVFYSRIKKEALSSLLTANVLPYLVIKSILISLIDVIYFCVVSLDKGINHVDN